jgi:hypothetical protein
VLGVDQGRPASAAGKAVTWAVTGWEPPGGEPDTFIGSCLAEGLDPRPNCLPRSWPCDQGRWVTVIRVLPVSVPPCVTNDGMVYERLPGSTQPVRTSETLRALVRRGAEARARAVTVAQLVLDEFWREMPSIATRRPQMAVCVTAPSFGEDIATSALRKSVADEMETLLPRFPGYSDRKLSSDASTVWAWANSGEAWASRVHRMGGVAVCHAGLVPDDGLSALAREESQLLKMWTIANRIAVVLGASGPSLARLRAWNVTADGSAYTVGGDFELWSNLDQDPTPDELAYVRRQASRRLGERVWEPERPR